MIEHAGSLDKMGNSEGHYICDVKDKLSSLWHRTNDSKIPEILDVQDVTENGYVILFKRQ